MRVVTSSLSLRHLKMIDQTFLTGFIGSIILVIGAGWPEIKGENHPTRSIKNRLFTFGGLTMLIYAILGYQAGGPVFFIFLEVLIVMAGILMMLNINEKVASIIISASGLGFIAWSLTIFESLNTVFFAIGLTGIGLGYVFKAGTLRRYISLILGSLLIAIFSFIEANWIFFWLNLIFAVLSGFQATRHSIFGRNMG